MSHASLNVDRKLVIEIGSDESKMFLFMCTWSDFAHFTTLLATRSSSSMLYRRGGRYGSPVHNEVYCSPGVAPLVHRPSNGKLFDCGGGMSQNRTPNRGMTRAT